MPLSLLFAGSLPWRLLTVMAVMLLLVTVKFQHDRIQDITRSLEEARATAEDQARIAENVRYESQRASKIMADSALKAEETRKEFSALRQEIYNNAPHDSDPLAPVLRKALDRLPVTHAVQDGGDT